MERGSGEQRQEPGGAVAPTAYEPPRLAALGSVYEHTLAKRGALTDGIHVHRSGGSVFVTHTSA